MNRKEKSLIAVSVMSVIMIAVGFCTILFAALETLSDGRMPAPIPLGHIIPVAIFVAGLIMAAACYAIEDQMGMLDNPYY